MSDVITLGEPARLQSRGCGCLRRDGGGGSRLVKRGSDLKCSKRSKLTQTSPQTSCLRVSLRQGNLAGAKQPVHVDTCVLLKSLGIGAWLGEGLQQPTCAGTVRWPVMDKARQGGFPLFV